MVSSNLNGEMAEWSIASDLKSDELTGSVSSNLTFSFKKKEKYDRKNKVVHNTKKKKYESKYRRRRTDESAIGFAKKHS
jgi:hypothetical protein